MVVIGWLAKFLILKVVVTSSPARGVELEKVIPWVRVGLGRMVNDKLVASLPVNPGSAAPSCQRLPSYSAKKALYVPGLSKGRLSENCTLPFGAIPFVD